LAALCILALLSMRAAAQSDCPSSLPTGTVQWATQWCDEFNGSLLSPIDSTKWQFDRGNLGVNNELEYYCAPSDSTFPCDPSNPNVYVDGGGQLLIQAVRINNKTSPGSNAGIMLALALALCMGASWTGCGGGSSTNPPVPPPSGGTPPGNYTVTVSAYPMSGDPANASTFSTVNVNLTVN